MKTKETGCELEKKTELLRDALNYLFNYLYAWVPQVSVTTSCYEGQFMSSLTANWHALSCVHS